MTLTWKLPEKCAGGMGDRERLWNDVEAFESARTPSLPARVEFAIRAR